MLPTPVRVYRGVVINIARISMILMMIIIVITITSRGIIKKVR